MMGKKRCHFPTIHKFKIHSLPDVCSALATLTTSICRFRYRAALRRMSRCHVFVVKIALNTFIEGVSHVGGWLVEWKGVDAFN